MRWWSCGQSLGREGWVTRQSDGLECGRGFVGEDASEVRAVGVDQDDLKRGCDEAWADSVTSHDDEVEDEDVDDDRAKDAEAERRGASNENEQTAEELKDAYVMHPASGAHDRHELLGGRTGRRRRGWHEGMDDVGAEDYKHEAEQDAADEIEPFHGGRHSLREVVERRSRTL